MAVETRVPGGKPLQKVENLNPSDFSKIKVVKCNIKSFPFV
jgi:hypothetical protein